MSSSTKVTLLSSVLQKEALDLVSRIWPDLSAAERQRVVDTVLSMPEEDTGKGKPDAEQHRDYRVFLRLSVLARHGEETLPDVGKVELGRLRQAYPEWRVDEGERAHFLTWMEPAVGWPSKVTAISLLAMDDEALARRLETEEQDRAGLMAAWFDACRQDPARGLAILRRLSSGNVEREDVWSSGINGLRMQFSQPTVADGVYELLPTLAAARFNDKHLLRAAAQILPEIAQNRDRALSADFWVLWNRLVERAAREGDLPQNNEWTQAAIYHPAGVLALALVTAFKRVTRKARESLGKFEPRFGRLLDDGVGLQFARIVLAGDLGYLHAIDPEWTARNFLSRMDWERSDEAAPLWQAFAYNHRLSPDLWGALSRSYFQAFDDDRIARMGRARDNLVCLLAIVGIDLGPAAPPAQQVHDLLARIETRDRIAIARWIWMRVVPLGRGKPPQEEQAKLRQAADEVWRRHISPWLRSVWPMQPDAQSPASSGNFALAAIATGGAFPETVRTLRPMLVPVDHPGTLLRSLGESSHPDDHAGESLDLLSRTVLPDRVVDFGGLSSLLDRLRRAKASLANEASFQAFETAARRVEAAQRAR